MTIEPFHGNSIQIYKKEENGYKKVWTYDNTIDFAHTLVGTTLCGKPSFVAGVRREEAELFYVQYVDGAYKATVIEKGWDRPTCAWSMKRPGSDCQCQPYGQ